MGEYFFGSLQKYLYYQINKFVFVHSAPPWTKWICTICAQLGARFLVARNGERSQNYFTVYSWCYLVARTRSESVTQRFPNVPKTTSPRYTLLNCLRSLEEIATKWSLLISKTSLLPFSYGSFGVYQLTWQSSPFLRALFNSMRLSEILL